jgi:hypothetical protein
MRRTPESEKAAAYSYGGLLRDITEKISRGATREVERITGGGLSNEELVEMALAPAGGMLKMAGTGKLLAGLLKTRALESSALRMSGYGKKAIESRMDIRFRPQKFAFKEALKVPEKEYGRIKDISWKVGHPSYKGEYDPHFKSIGFNPRTVDLETVWHEFTHARQWNPEKFVPMPVGEGTEAAKAQELRDLTEMLTEVARKAKIPAREFYWKISPTERHARGTARYAVESPRHFDLLYKYALKSEITHSKRKLHDLLMKIDKETRNKMGHYLEGD